MLEDKTVLLNAILAAWPKGTSGISLDLNPASIGQDIGLDNERVASAVRQLVDEGLLHSRELDGLSLVHPTLKALSLPSEATATKPSLFQVVAGELLRVILPWR